MGKLKDVDLNFKDLPDSIDPNLTESSESMPFAKEAFSALKDLLAALAAESSALRDEVIINFNSMEDYENFLNGIADRKIKLLGSSDNLIL